MGPSFEKVCPWQAVSHRGPGAGSSSCEEWAGQDGDKRASKSWGNGPPTRKCTQGHGKHFAVLASPEPWKVKCDLVLKEGGKPVEKELETAVMLPHLWVLCAQENELLHSITCTNEELAVFWKSQMKSPQMTQELKRMIEASEPTSCPSHMSCMEMGLPSQT